MTIPGNRIRLSAPAAGPDRMPPIYITCDSMLCELRVWTTTELPESKELERALALTRVPGLGWVGAVPIEMYELKSIPKGTPCVAVGCPAPLMMHDSPHVSCQWRATLRGSGIRQRPFKEVWSNPAGHQDQRQREHRQFSEGFHQSDRICRIRPRWATIPVRPTMSARAHRSKSISSIFSSTRVSECPFGVKAASSGRHATGMLARLPSNGRACSKPEYETSNRGLIRMISAMDRRTPRYGTGDHFVIASAVPSDRPAGRRPPAQRRWS